MRCPTAIQFSLPRYSIIIIQKLMVVHSNSCLLVPLQKFSHQ